MDNVVGCVGSIAIDVIDESDLNCYFFNLQSNKDLTTIASLVEENGKKYSIPKSTDFFDKIPLYRPDDFIGHFRVSRETAEIICAILPKSPCQTKMKLDVQQCTLIGLWTLATKEGFREISIRFGISMSTAHDVFSDFCSAIAREKDRYILWPSEWQYSNVAEGFKRFPDTLAALDGSHIAIKAPKDTPEIFYNRKSFHSINLMAACNAKMKFVMIYVGWPGSVHDARVFRNCALYELLNGRTFPKKYHVIADSAFGLTLNLMVPFKDNGSLTAEQINFNKTLSGDRMAIERAFGLLKGKFRRLHYLDVNSVEMASTIITAACVLHNLYISSDEWNESDILSFDDSEEELYTLMSDDNKSNSAAIAKRNMIAGSLFM